MRVVCKYISFDEESFNSEIECREHERWVLFHPGVEFLDENLEPISIVNEEIEDLKDFFDHSKVGIFYQIDCLHRDAPYIRITTSDKAALKALEDYWGWTLSNLDPGIYKYYPITDNWVPYKKKVVVRRKKNGKNLPHF